MVRSAFSKRASRAVGGGVLIGLLGLPQASAEDGSYKPSQTKGIESIYVDRVAGGSLSTGSKVAFRLRLDTGQRVEMDAVSGAIDTRLTIYDSSDRQIAANSDGGPNRNAKILLQAPLSRVPGHTYYVVVENEGKTNGNFELILRARPAVRPPDPTTIAFGSDVGGRLDERSSIRAGEGFPYAVHSFDGVAGERIRIGMSSPEFDPALELRFAGEVVAADDDGGQGNSAQISQRLAKTGPYEIWANANAKLAGKYLLSLKKIPEPAAAPTISSVAFGQSIDAEVGDGSALIRRFELGGTSSTGRNLARLPDGCAVSGNDRPHGLYRLSGSAGQRTRVTVVPKQGTTFERCAVVVEVGVDSPIGFASIWRRGSVPTARFQFENNGDVLIRISTNSGGNAAYVLKVEDDALPASAAEY